MDNERLMLALNCAINLLFQTKDFQNMELYKFKNYTIKKLNLTEDEWYEIMSKA